MENKLSNKVLSKIEKGDILGTKLENDDLKCLKDEVNLLYHEKPNYFTMFSCLKWCSKN